MLTYSIAVFLLSLDSQVICSVCMYCLVKSAVIFSAVFAGSFVPDVCIVWFLVVCLIWQLFIGDLFKYL